MFSKEGGYIDPGDDFIYPWWTAIGSNIFPMNEVALATALKYDTVQIIVMSLPGIIVSLASLLLSIRFLWLTMSIGVAESGYVFFITSTDKR